MKIEPKYNIVIIFPLLVMLCFLIRETTEDSSIYLHIFTDILIIVMSIFLYHFITRKITKEAIRTSESYERIVQHFSDTQHQLREEKEYANNIINSMLDAVITINDKGIIQTFNQSAESMFLYKAPDTIGQNIMMLMESSIRKHHDTYIKQYLLTGKTNIIGTGRELSGLRSDGTSFPMFLSITKKEHNRNIIFIGVISDLTNINLERERREKSNLDLLDSYKALKNTQEQLLQAAKLSSIGEMATGMAHELNQPLSIISMSAELQLDLAQQGNFGNVKQSYERILSQVSRASAIIDHLRTFGRDSTSVSKTSNDINRIIKDSTAMMLEQLNTNNVNLIFDLENKKMTVYCNAIQLEQVISNLVINAKHAVSESSTKDISISSRLNDGRATIEIHDTGTGIPEDIIEKIFDPFFTTKDVGKGTGLGLSISYGIISEHNGKLSVTSSPASGTTFRITLPIQPVSTDFE